MGIPNSPNARLFYRAAKQRLEDALLLLQLKRTTGAVYLAGYSVECMLKALILESVPENQEMGVLGQFRGQHAHEPEWLFRLYRRGANVQPPVSLIPHLARVNTWSTSMRYLPGTLDEGDAERFIDSVQQVVVWVEGRL